MNTIRSTIKFFIGWPLSLIALFFIGKIILPGIPYIATHITQINGWALFASILFYLSYFFLRSIFWQKVLALKGHSLPLQETTYLWTTSEIKRYLPGNVWAIVGRTLSFAKKDVAKTTTLHAYVLESEFVFIASFFISIFSLPFVYFTFVPDFALKNIVFYLLCFFSLCIVLAFLLSQKILQGFIHLPVIKHLILPFSFQENTNLFAIMSLAFFFFGLATYCSVISLFFISPHQLFIIASFFVFALLVGYISFITPMGLGVREGVMTVGLHAFLPITLAGFAAIFARILFSLSEVIFLALAYYWNHTKNKQIKVLQRTVKTYWHELILFMASLTFFIYFTLASFYRYINFYTGRFDLGNMDQTVWNTLHGRIFQLTDPNGTAIVSRLAFHADFILALLSPLYIVWQDPRMLLAIQALTLTFGGLFVYLIAKKILHDKTVALVLAIGFLLNPSVELSVLYDFHAVVLATTFLLGAWYFILQKKPFWYCLFLVLAGLTKEQVWFVIALIGIYLFLFEKTKKMGGIIFVVSLGIFWYITFRAIPHAAGGQQFAISYLSDFGASPSAILKGIIFSPQKTLGTFLEPSRLYYLFQLFSPLGFLSLLFPIQLIFALPDLTLNMLSNNGQLHQIYFQYTAIITPFIFISSIYGIAFLLQKFPTITFKKITCYVILTLGVAAWQYGPLPGEKNPNLDMFFKPQQNRQIIENFLQDIPPKLSIAASNNIGSHLSHRQNIYTIPTGIDKADIILFLLNDQYAQPSLAAQIHMADAMKHDQKYIEVFRLADFVVFEKRNLYLHKEPDLTKTKLFPFAIPALQSRDFEGGKITVINVLQKEKKYINYEVTYPSDGLQIHALMAIPTSPKPQEGFPVIIVNHGQVSKADYNLERSYSEVVSYFASQGFLVIKPDFRNNGTSEKESSLSYAVTYPIDVLNLLSSLPSIQQASTQHIFLWGHSLGGEVTLATLAIHDQNNNIGIPITASVVWAPIADPYRGYVQLHALFSNNNIPFEKFAKDIGISKKSTLLWQSVSPLYYLDDIQTPFVIRHGEEDAIIPYQWSLELSNDAQSLDLPVSMYLYPSEDHTFSHKTTAILAQDTNYFKSFLGK